MTYYLFFELIQVSIGRRDELSRVPSAKEWCELYGLSVKQAVAGVCIVGVQRLTKEQRKGMPKGLMMAGGNFGHHDERIRKVGKGKWQWVFSNLQHAIYVLRRYPQEALWMPVWLVYHFVWKRTLKI